MPVHDTTYITLTDTLTNTVYDTTYINVPVHDTTYIMLTDTVTNTVYDTIVNMVDNYIYDTIWLYDTVTVHDTIYIGQDGIDDVDADGARVYSSQGQIVVEGAEGSTVALYDAVGRRLAVRRNEEMLWGMPLRFDVPASGTYLIRVGDTPARRIVVVR